MTHCKSHEPCPGAPCTHYIRAENKLEAGLCSLPGEFRCTEAIRVKSMKLSHSAVQNYLRCKRYYWYANIKGIRVLSHMVSRALKMGGLWDKVQGGASNREIREYIGKIQIDPMDAARVRAVWRGYREFEMVPDTDGLIGTQEHFEYHHWDNEAGDVIVQGYYDRLHTDHFAECKFSSRPENYLTAWGITSQVGTYFLANPELKYCVMEVTRAPQQRAKEDETPEELEKRIYNDVLKRPSYYFQGFNRDKRVYGIKFYRADFNLDELQNRYTHIIREIKQSAKHESFYQNNTACLMYGTECDFKPVCVTGCVSQEIFTYRDKSDN